MRATCPECGAQAHLSAFFAEDDGKRLAALLAGMQPELGRAVIGYLGLFKPAKTALRLARALKIAQEVAELVASGTVCKDERTGVRRPALPAHWSAGIEQMLAQRDRLTLPLESHGYLRAVVYGIADSADAAAERATEERARSGRHLAGGEQPAGRSASEDKLSNQLAWIEQQLNYGAMTASQAEIERNKAFQRYGNGGK